MQIYSRPHDIYCKWQMIVFKEEGNFKYTYVGRKYYSYITNILLTSPIINDNGSNTVALLYKYVNQWFRPSLFHLDATKEPVNDQEIFMSEWGISSLNWNHCCVSPFSAFSNTHTLFLVANLTSHCHLVSVYLNNMLWDNNEEMHYCCFSNCMT